jgi:exodeoxyribonuclease V alpha subunit
VTAIDAASDDAMTSAPDGEPFDSARSVAATGALADFSQVGLLAPADVHTAVRLARLGVDTDPRVALGVAFAVRGPRFGHVYVDLAAVRHTATDVDEDVDLDSLPWPDPDEWRMALAASSLVAVGEDGASERPLRLIGTALYLDRYWRDERAVAADLARRADAPPPPYDREALTNGLDRIFPEDRTGEQRWAAAAGVMRRLAIIAGGPGTGKTTTLARLLALLRQQADACSSRPPLVALAAPTGKAAARMEEAVHREAAVMPVAPVVRDFLLSTRGSTLHRLLGKRPGSSSRFRYDRHNRLPHEVVVVDETSMVSLSLMARLAEAVRPDARLILVGDPEQLASVEAGAVLGDIVGPALTGMRMSQAASHALEEVTGFRLPTSAPSAGASLGAGAASLGDGLVILRANYRFRGALADLADAVRQGDADAVLGVLHSGSPAIRWLPFDPADDQFRAYGSGAGPIGEAAIDAGAALLAAANAGDSAAAVEELGRFRVLCAHRHGPSGVSIWTEKIEELLSTSVPGFVADGEWYPGRPVMVTSNDYGLRLFNGDTGAAIIRPEGGLAVAFRRGGAVVSLSPSRLAAVETVFAMTVHKAQGSEFRRVAVILPVAESPILTRELLYTAVTRAQEELIVAGSEASLRAGLGRPIARASGLTRRLWG